MEDCGAGVAVIDDVVTDSSNGGAGGARDGDTAMKHWRRVLIRLKKPGNVQVLPG